jgi:4'-phosphopantetheinyl transferase
MSEKSEFPEASKDGLMMGHNSKSGIPPLLNGEIHVWTASLDCSKVEIEGLRSLLSHEEKKKASYYKFELEQHRYIVTQAVIRILISAYLDLEPGEILLDARKKGKPYIINQPSLFFNISNSHDVCVYAFSRDNEVGIDIEKIRDLPDLDLLIEKNLTSREKTCILKDPDTKLSRFFQFWTFKESYLKAIGEGMRLTPDNLEFSLEEGTIRLRSVKYGFDVTDWQFKGFTREGNYTGTLTYTGKETVIKEMDFEGRCTPVSPGPG